MLRLVDRFLLLPIYRALRRAEQSEKKAIEDNTAIELSETKISVSRYFRPRFAVLCAGVISVFISGVSSVQLYDRISRPDDPPVPNMVSIPDYEVCVRLVEKFDGDTAKAFNRRPLCEEQYNEGPYKTKPGYEKYKAKMEALSNDEP